MIYLDYNATTPIASEVAAAMIPYLFGHFGNPSSSHALGREAKADVDRARGQVASLVGCSPSEIVFTSGGSESDNMTISRMEGFYAGNTCLTLEMAYSNARLLAVPTAPWLAELVE